MKIREKSRFGANKNCAKISNLRQKNALGGGAGQRAAAEGSAGSHSRGEQSKPRL